ncbi:unnamed protein product [Pseudo-nitzschia multistriata]|uniref:t-SNARE coiled-coil homology domain-containing protein n=1 Tax=Pseudo-nitzschia multistriata TaxID=183589 RepID=A0A448Z325_9STRA|nr:unnamed protein product [Pseudo-nitzschia multistriata]
MEALTTSRGSCGSFNHAVSRSSELLSCAKTAWKLREREQLRLDQQKGNLGTGGPPPPPPRNNPNLRLASSEGPPPTSLAVLDDGFTLLRAMDYGTKKLQALVRRRGHTNDPTHEIASLVKQLEQDLKELTSYCKQLLMIRRRKQEQRHWELVVEWFQQVASRNSGQLHECLKLRGEILAEQAQKHRKLVESSGGNKSKTSVPSNGVNHGAASVAPSMSATATPLFDSTLFTSPKGSQNTLGKDEDGKSDSLRQRNKRQPNSRKTPSAALNGSSSNYYRGNTPVGPTSGGYGAVYGGVSAGGYAGYGGGGYGSSGMRQRRGGTSYSSLTIPAEEQEEEQKVHSQIQMRERKRQTQQRLDEARQAESTLSEVSKLYSKMSTLITQQGETLEKIEDDVECALVDVTAGQEELTKLYAIKKGNRPLIIKTFLILNFLIVFMRAYRDR